MDSINKKLPFSLGSGVSLLVIGLLGLGTLIIIQQLQKPDEKPSVMGKQESVEHKTLPRPTHSVSTNQTQNGSVTLKLVPAASTLKTGETVTVDVLLDSENQPINVVKSVINYPVDSLKMVSINASGSAFPVKAEEVASPGVITITRGATTPVFGSSQKVAVLTFQALEGKEAKISFVTASTAAISADTNTNVVKILQDVTLPFEASKVGDLNNDGQINVYDLSELLSKYGQ